MKLLNKILFALLATTILLSACSKEKEPEEPAVTNKHTYNWVSEDKKSGISVEIGDKNGEKWLSNYNVRLHLVSTTYKAGPATLEVSELKNNLKGISKLQHDAATGKEVTTVYLTSSNVATAESYIKIALDLSDETSVLVYYHVYSANKEIAGNKTVTLTKIQ